MSEPLEMNVDFETSDTEMNLETDMNCNIEVPLPIASATQLGGIKVGENLSIAPDGTLSAEVPEEDIEQLQEDVSGLKEDIDEYLIEQSQNLYNRNDTVNGQYYNIDGDKISSGSYATVDIDIHNYSKVEYGGLATIANPVYSVWLDSERTVISSFKCKTGDNNVIDVPEGSYYVGFSIRNSIDINNFTVIGYNYGSVFIRLDTINDKIKSFDTELKSVSEDFDGAKKVLNLEIINFTKGAYINTTVDNISDSINAPKVNANWEYAILSCAEGDTFDLNCNGATNPRPYAFADTAYNVLLRSDANSFSGKVTAPKNSAYLVVNKLISNESLNLIGVTSIDSLEEEVQYYGKNIVMPGHKNMIWSWWIYPQVIHLNRIRNQIIWGYTTKDGYKGVASYNITDKEYTKNNIAKASVDDHNSLAVFAFDNGIIVAAYSTGHNEDNFMHVRLSSVEECIEHFEDDIPLISSGNTAYCQLLYGNNALYMFYRVNVTSWAYRKSADYGKTWSNEVVLITSPVQYYCKFAYTTTDTVFRVLMYSNPALSEGTDANIRQAFFHLDNDSLYDSDNATVLGTSDISKDNVTVLIPVTSDYATQRLLDVAITDIGRPLVLFVPIPSSGIRYYTIYDSGNRIPVAECGKSLFSTYVLGASWIGTEKIILSNGTDIATNKDNINVYSYTNGDVSLIETLYSELRGSLPIRNARPISDKNGDSVLWFRGYYGKSYTAFNTDAMLHIFD